MRLFGERIWYLPRWLGWIPQLSHGEPTREQEAKREDDVDDAPRSLRQIPSGSR